jgi:hypothetical protein
VASSYVFTRKEHRVTSGGRTASAPYTMKKGVSPVARQGEVRLPHTAHESSSIHFLPSLLHLSIAFWMCWGGVANLDAKIFTVPLEGTTSELGPIVSDVAVWDPKSAYDGLDELHY